MMSAYEVKAIQDKGVHVVMKHFALNDCEQDRIGLGVWLNEQAAREVYLKAFQAPVEVGNANGVMIAYTRWGAVWSGGNYGLVTGILRNEWGCDGMVITDNVLTQYVNGPDGVLAGVSIYDAMMSFVTDTLPKYKNDPVIVTAMREACHHEHHHCLCLHLHLPAGHRDVDHWRHQVPQDRRIQGLQGFQKIPESR